MKLDLTKRDVVHSLMLGAQEALNRTSPGSDLAHLIPAFQELYEALDRLDASLARTLLTQSFPDFIFHDHRKEAEQHLVSLLAEQHIRLQTEELNRPFHFPEPGSDSTYIQPESGKSYQVFWGIEVCHDASLLDMTSIKARILELIPRLVPSVTRCKVLDPQRLETNDRLTRKAAKEGKEGSPELYYVVTSLGGLQLLFHKSHGAYEYGAYIVVENELYRKEEPKDDEEKAEDVSESKEEVN